VSSANVEERDKGRACSKQDNLDQQVAMKKSVAPNKHSLHIILSRCIIWILYFVVHYVPHDLPRIRTHMIKLY
jgi:hypothetical protein